VWTKLFLAGALGAALKEIGFRGSRVKQGRLAIPAGID
jgi:hypothetical protein